MTFLKLLNFVEESRGLKGKQKLNWNIIWINLVRTIKFLFLFGIVIAFWYLMLTMAWDVGIFTERIYSKSPSLARLSLYVICISGTSGWVFTQPDRVI